MKFKHIKEAALDQTLVDELVLYITNDGDLYRQRVTPIVKNLRKKYEKGNYDPKLALKIWKPLADEGAKKYGKDFASGEKEGLSMFPPAERKAATEQLRDYYEDEFMEEGE